ncbi:hypothetical protein [Bacillus altitudinis]|uniref:hypothetical protein n=1 Tax=Bacillus altitudinis TaxID=293387 RepID=UPI0030C84458
MDNHTAIRIDVIRALIGLEGDIRMGSTLYSKKGIELDGHYKDRHKNNRLKFFIDNSYVELLREAKDFNDVYEIYESIGYFKEV